VGLSNEMQNGFTMHGYSLKQEGEPKAYTRRLDLANELIEEIGRNDWALGLGLMNEESSEKVEIGDNDSTSSKQIHKDIQLTKVIL
jgi:hypothetical protein